MIPDTFIEYVKGQSKKLPRNVYVFKGGRTDKPWEYIIEINNVKYKFGDGLRSMDEVRTFKKKLSRKLLKSFRLYSYDRDGLTLVDDAIYELPQDIVLLIANNLDEKTLLMLSQANKEVNENLKLHFDNVRNSKYIKRLQEVRDSGVKDVSYGNFRYIPKYSYEEPLFEDNKIRLDVFTSLLGWKNMFNYLDDTVPTISDPKKLMKISPHIISWYDGKKDISGMFNEDHIPILRHCIKYHAYVNNRQINYKSFKTMISQHAQDLIENIYLDLGLYADSLELTPKFRTTLLSTGSYPLNHLELIYNNLDIRKDEVLSADYWPYAHLNKHSYPRHIVDSLITKQAAIQSIRDKAECNKSFVFNFPEHSSDVLKELKIYLRDLPTVITFSLIMQCFGLLNDEDTQELARYLTSYNYERYLFMIDKINDHPFTFSPILELIEYAQFRTLRYYYKEGYWTYHILVIFYRDENKKIKNVMTIKKGSLMKNVYKPVKSDELIGDHILGVTENVGPEYTKHPDFKRLSHEDFMRLNSEAHGTLHDYKSLSKNVQHMFKLIDILADA